MRARAYSSSDLSIILLVAPRTTRRNTSQMSPPVHPQLLLTTDETLPPSSSSSSSSSLPHTRVVHHASIGLFVSSQCAQAMGKPRVKHLIDFYKLQLQAKACRAEFM